jgi:hypothetical protein
MDNYKSALGVGKGLYRAEYSAATVCSVTGIYIHVQGTKAKRTMVSGRIAQRLDGFAAAFADEAGVVFLEWFLFHIYTSRGLFSNAES